MLHLGSNFKLMSKLAYSDEVDNGGDGWGEEFGEDLDVDLPQAITMLPDPPTAVEDNYSLTQSGNNEPDIQNTGCNYALPSELESDQVDAQAIHDNAHPITVGYESAFEQSTVEDQRSEALSSYDDPQQNAPLELNDTAREIQHEESPRLENIEPSPAMVACPDHSNPLVNETPDAHSTVSNEANSSQGLSVEQVPIQPIAATPATISQTSHAGVSVPTYPTPAVAALNRTLPAVVPARHMLPAAPSPSTVQNPTQPANTRKPGLVLPQVQIKYKGPMDYASLLSKHSNVARVNQASVGSSTVPSAAGSRPLVSTITAAPIVSSQNRLSGDSAASAISSKVNPNIMSYPPQKITSEGNIQATYAPSAVATQRPAQPIATSQKPQNLPIQSTGAATHQQHYTNIPPSSQVSRSKTMPDIGDQQQLQHDLRYAQQSHPVMNGDGYLSEHEDPGQKARTGTEERRRHKKHRSRQSMQPPAPDYSQMAYYAENPQAYQDYYRQWYEAQQRMYGWSGASTPAYDQSDAGSEYGGDSRSRPSSRMSIGAYASPAQANNPYANYYQQFQTGGAADAQAAWWYWYYMQLQQQQQQPQIPQRPSTPKKFAYPHCRATFSSSGFLITVMPGRAGYAATGLGSSATRVNVLRTIDVIAPGIPELKEYTEFPGPLVPTESHKIDVINFAQRMSQQALLSDYLDKDSVNLLWRFIELLVRQNGTYFGADVSHLLTEALPPLPDQLIEPADQSILAPAGSIKQLRDLLLHGRKREAVEFAVSHNLWAHAMFLAHSISEQYFLAIRNRFLNSSAAPGDPLATFYQLTTLSSPVISRNAVTSDMHSWRQHLAVILSNAAVSPQFQRQLLLSLGDTLRSQGRLYAAQLCYLMAGDQFSAFPPSSNQENFASATRMILLGTEPAGEFHLLAKPYFCQLTEMYEYCLRLNNPRSVLPAFQLFKAFYCLCLAEAGLVHEAFRYLISLIESLQICFHTFPNMSNYFPRVCFKWLADLYTTLHKSEPAIDFGTVEWIFEVSRGGPIRPPPLQQPVATQPVQQPQQIPSWYAGNGGNMRQEEFRNVTQTPGPYGASNPNFGAGNPPTHQLSSNQYKPFNHSTDSTNSQFQHQHSMYSNHEASSQSVEHQSSFAQPPPADPPRPFAESARFDTSTSGPSFGNSQASWNSINRIIGDIRKDALGFSHGEQQNLAEKLHEQVNQNQQQHQPQQNQVNQHDSVTEDSAASHHHHHHNHHNHHQQQQQQPPQHVAEPVSQPYVAPLSSWAPAAQPTTQQPTYNDNYGGSNGNFSNPPSRNDYQEPAPTPQPDSDRSPKKKDTPASGGLISKIWPFGNNSANKQPVPTKMVLPDDRKPTLVFDKNKNRWIDTSKPEGEDDVDEAPPPPPPTLGSFAAPSPAAPAAGSMVTPTFPSGASNMSIGARGRSRYVDVLKPSGASGTSATTGSASLLQPAMFAPAPTTQTFFVPPPAPPQDPQN